MSCVYRKVDSAENGPESVGVVGSAHAAGRGIVTLSGVGRKSSNPSFLHAAVAALSHTPNASVRRLLNWVLFRR